MKSSFFLVLLTLALVHITSCLNGVDTDGDGEPDMTDLCPLDPGKVAPGECGCGVAEGTCSETDTDGDGTPDQNDGCPSDPQKIEPGECGCGVTEGTCTACDDGFVVDNGVCVDVNECLTDNGGCEEICINLEGTFSCDCNEGGILNADQQTCNHICDNLSDHYVEQPNPPSTPPYSGTVWLSTEIITEDDPTAFRTLTYQGQGERVMFDRRTNSFESYHAHLFDTQFGNDVLVEVQVNPEFSASDAKTEAKRYATVIGRLPAFLFRDIETVWIHRGSNAFGGGNNNLLIHTEKGQEYMADGVLEEVFIHEATHTSIDATHQDIQLWRSAQNTDGMAISQYALDHPRREDLAETLGPYLAIRFRADRITNQLFNLINNTIPNRIKYLDCLNLSMQVLP